MDVPFVQGYENVLITLTGGDSESTCEVGCGPFPTMPGDGLTVGGKRGREEESIGRYETKKI